VTAANALGDLGEIREVLVSSLRASLQAGRDDATGRVGERS
jgi:hypothetical protein